MINKLFIIFILINISCISAFFSCKEYDIPNRDIIFMDSLYYKFCKSIIDSYHNNQLLNINIDMKVGVKISPNNKLIVKNLSLDWWEHRVRKQISRYVIILNNTGNLNYIAINDYLYFLDYFNNVTINNITYTILDGEEYAILSYNFKSISMYHIKTYSLINSILYYYLFGIDSSIKLSSYLKFNDFYYEYDDVICNYYKDNCDDINSDLCIKIEKMCLYSKSYPKYATTNNNIIVIAPFALGII